MSSLLLLLMLMTSFTLRTASADDARMLLDSLWSVHLLRLYAGHMFTRVFCCFAGYCPVLQGILLFCRACLHVYSVVLQGTGLHVHSVVLHGTHLHAYSVVLQGPVYACCFAGHIFTCIL